MYIYIYIYIRNYLQISSLNYICLLFIYIYIYIYTHTHTHIYIYTCMYIKRQPNIVPWWALQIILYIYIYIYIYIYWIICRSYHWTIFGCLYIYIYIELSSHLFTGQYFASFCIYVYIYMCVCVCVWLSSDLLRNSILCPFLLSAECFISDKIKQDFFQAVAVWMLLYGCTTWMLTKCIEKRLDKNYTTRLHAVLNKSWKQHSTKQWLYIYQLLISQTIQVRVARHAGHCWKSKDEPISDVLLWTPTHGYASVSRPARTYISSVGTLCAVYNTYQER